MSRSCCCRKNPENAMEKQYKTFVEFYPFYLAEHSHPTCRKLHFFGSLLVLVILAYAVVSGEWKFLLLMPVAGYGFAWVGHFIFEKNRPATFTYPWMSLKGDGVMFRDILTGKISLKSGPRDTGKQNSGPGSTA